MWEGLKNKLNTLNTLIKEPSGKDQTIDSTANGLISDRRHPSKYSIFGEHRTMLQTTQPNENTTSETINRNQMELAPQQNRTALQNNLPTIALSEASNDLSLLLTEEQRLAFNWAFFRQLTDPRYAVSAVQRDIVVDADLLHEQMAVINDLVSIVNIQKLTKTTESVADDSEVEVFKIQKDTKAIRRLFQQKEALIIKEAILENQFDLENDLFRIKSHVNKLMLSGHLQKCNLIDRFYTAALANIGQTEEAIVNLKKQRYCLMAIKKNALDTASIGKKISRKKELEKLLSLYVKFNERFKKMNLMMNQKFSVERSCNIYNNLIVALIYCHKKIGSGLDLVMLAVYKRKLEDRLIYSKHKLNHNLFFELKMYKSCKEKFNMNMLTDIVKQMASIEEVAKSFLSNSSLQLKEVRELLRKDEFLLRAHFKNPVHEAELFTDPEVKQVVVGIYKGLIQNVGKK